MLRKCQSLYLTQIYLFLEGIPDNMARPPDFEYFFFNFPLSSAHLLQLLWLPLPQGCSPVPVISVRRKNHACILFQSTTNLLKGRALHPYAMS